MRNQSAIDPAPRKYGHLATVLRRSSNKGNCGPQNVSTDAVQEWLLAEALQEQDILALVESLAWNMVNAGLPLDRFTVHVGTLHPQLLGFYWHWERADGIVDELKVDRAGFDSDSYRKSPLARVIESGCEFRARTDDHAALDQYPLLGELKDKGIQDYAVLPMGASRQFHNAATVSTFREQGITDEEMYSIRKILRVFSLHMERYIHARIAQNTMDTYLGSVAGKKVLSGAIERGAGESMQAVIWVSDLRGFSTLVDSMEAEAVLAILNEYFDRLVDAVTANGGEVLKFIGDGLLAVFPITEENDESAAAAQSLMAAEKALESVAALNESPPDSIAAVKGWNPLRSGIALHMGEVFFGNVGAPTRLDFTVIGKAVNEASRVETLARELQKQILITAPVAHLLERNLDKLGSYDLRGLSEKIDIFSLR